MRAVRAPRLLLLPLVLLGWLLAGAGAARAAQIEGPATPIREGEVAEFRVVRGPGDPAPLRLELVGDTAATDEVLALSRPIEVWGAEGVVRVQALPDSEYGEPDERFVLRTTDGSASASATIADSTRCPRGWRVQGMIAGGEVTGAVRIRLVTCNLEAAPERLSFRTAETGTARAGVDFEPRSGELLFPQGTTTQDIVIPVIDDSQYEPQEQFDVVLVSADGREARITMQTFDDDRPDLLLAPLTVAEGDAPVVARLPLRFTGPVPYDLRLRLWTRVGTGPLAATPGADFLLGEQVVGFPTGQVAGEAALAVTGDDRDEPDEHFLVAPEWSQRDTAALIAGSVIPGPDVPPVAVTIADDDGPAVSIAAPRLDGTGAVTVGVACAAAAGTCAGSATIALAGSATTAATRGPVRTFRAADARRRKLRLDLPRHARARLRSGRAVRVRTTVRAQGSDGDLTVRTRSATLRRPRR
jgi:hypothetical protein